VVKPVVDDEDALARHTEVTHDVTPRRLRYGDHRRGAAYPGIVAA
jgi:hypothetical protein